MNELPIEPIPAPDPHPIDGLPGADKPKHPEIAGAIPGPPIVSLKVKVPFYYRNGFKRFMGVLSIGFGVCALVPHPAVQIIGQGGMLVMGGYLAYVGVKDASDKKKAGNGNASIFQLIIEILEKIIQIIRKRK